MDEVVESVELVEPEPSIEVDNEVQPVVGAALEPESGLEPELESAAVSTTGAAEIPEVFEPPAEPAPKKSRAGRNLPAAIGVAFGLLGLLALTLAFRPEPFVVFVAVAISAGLWELKSAFEHQNLQIAIWPLLAGASAMIVASFLGGIGALLTTFILTLLAIVGWQFALAGMERAPVSRTNIMASILAATYLPFMASFVILIMRQHTHAPYWRVALLILLCVANDTGGYFAGIFLGKHPMAPSVSPKKSWEGFGGSILLTCLVGILGSYWILGLPFTPNLSVAGNPAYPGPLWLSIFGSAIGLGLLLGVLTAITSTIGDLSESLSNVIWE